MIFMAQKEKKIGGKHKPPTVGNAFGQMKETAPSAQPVAQDNPSQVALPPIQDKAALNEALHLAVFADDVLLVGRMLNQGADVDARDGEGNTPLLSAAYFRRPMIACLLLERGADVNAKCNGGATPLMKAAMDNDLYLNVLHLLIEKGADANARDDFGCTALMWAAGCGREWNAKYLMEKGADATLKANDGSTAVSLATPNFPNIVGMLKLYGVKE